MSKMNSEIRTLGGAVLGGHRLNQEEYNFLQGEYRFHHGDCQRRQYPYEAGITTFIAHVLLVDMRNKELCGEGKFIQEARDGISKELN